MDQNPEFPNRLNDLNLLVEELMKDSPDEKFVKKSMAKLGIEYTSDPIERINKVLLALHPPIEEQPLEKSEE